MTDSLILQLKDWGIPESDIFSEAFGTSSKQSEAKPSKAKIRKQSSDGQKLDRTMQLISAEQTSQQSKVVFNKSGRTDVWDGSDNDLLSLASKNGVEIESACGSGSCGSCQTGIRSGKVKYNDEPCFSCEEEKCFAMRGSPRW